MSRSHGRTIARQLSVDGTQPVAAADDGGPARPRSTPPISGKGQRTRARLLQAARKVFERSGSYADTTVQDLVKAAGVSHGTFYTYFANKEALFGQLAAQVVDEMYVEATSTYRGTDPVERIRASNHQFVASYRKHAAMMTIIEQAASLHAQFRALRRELRDRFVRRIAVNIERMIVRGVADPDLDPVLTAHLLVSMTDNFSYVWFVLGEDVAEHEAMAALDRVWMNALRLT